MHGLPSFSSDAPSKAIDWVLMSPRKDWQVLEVAVLLEPVASDHAPLRAVLRYTPTR